MRALLRLGLTLSFSLAMAACHPEDGARSNSGWHPAALSAADGIAQRIRATGRPCEEYRPYDFGTIAHDYEGRLPLPTAMASCTTRNDEDLEIAVFATPEAMAAFVEAKRAAICRAAATKHVRFPGFPYVASGTWMVQPDHRATAEDLARILGVTARVAECLGESPPS